MTISGRLRQPGAGSLALSRARLLPLKAAGRVAGPFILRLGLGRRPTRDELRTFRAALVIPYLRGDLGFPPLIRALMALPTGRLFFRLATQIEFNDERAGLAAGDVFATRLSPGLVQGPPDLGGNLFTAWTGRNLAFLHFEKCGGIAVMLWLAPQFHPTQIDPDPSRAAPPQEFHRAPGVIGREPARYPLLWGHYDLPALTRIDRGRFVFTFLREPRARLISLYHYWRSVEPAKLDDPETDVIVGAAHRLPLAEFLRSDHPLLRDYLDNVYTRRLTGLYQTGALRDPLAAARETALDRAREALARLGFVGISERMDDSIARLASLTGAAPPARTARVNSFEENHVDPSGWFRSVGRIPVTSEIEAELDRLTRFDQILYAEALARFDGLAPAGAEPAMAAV
jgi:hypothetical protein